MPLAQQVTGAGTVGTPDPGILTVQGPTGGLPVIATGFDSFNVLPSAVRGTSVISTAYLSAGYRGLLIAFNVTAVPGVSTVQVALVTSWPGGVDRYFVLFPNVIAISNSYYIVYPGFTASDLATGGYQYAKQTPIPGKWKLYVGHTGAGNFTYSVDVIPLP